MFTAYRAPPESGGSGTVAAICVLCQTSVSPKDMALIECGMLPNAHQNSIHVLCGERYATNESNKFLKSGRISAICPSLAGGGASANLVSNTLLKALGLQDMLDLTTASKNKSSASSLNGKMPEKYLKKAKEWANDKSTAKKLLLAACPHEAGCGLTIEKYKISQESDSRVATKEQPTAAPRKVISAAAEVSDEDEDNGRCVGTKSNGTQCQRFSTESGGDVDKKLCRRCKESAEQIAARAAAAAAQEGVKRTKAAASDTKRMAKPKLGGMSALLKSAAKPVATCQSCAAEYFAERGGICPTTGEKLCNKCMQPILDAAAALASEAKKMAESAASAQSTLPASMVPSNVKGGRPLYKQTIKMPSAKYPKINFAGRIIGKGGEDIRKLKAETGCCINVEDPIVFIESKSPECIDDAVARITSILDAAAQYAEELDIRYGHSNDADTYTDESMSWGGGGANDTDPVDRNSHAKAGVDSSEYNHGVHAAATRVSEAKNMDDGAISVQPTQPTMVTSNVKGGRPVYKQTITMPSAKYPKINFAGRIIGKGGEDIRKLKAETGCYINVEDPIVYIESKSPECIDDAVARITSILDAAAQYAEELNIRYGHSNDADTYADESMSSGGGGGSLTDGGNNQGMPSDGTDPADRKSHAKAGVDSSDYDHHVKRSSAKPAFMPGSRSASEAERHVSPPLGLLAATKEKARYEIPVESAQAAAVNALLAPSDDECAICIESLVGASTSMLPCGHTFHSACVEKIKEYNTLTSASSVCPLCQQTFKSPVIQPQESVSVAPFSLDSVQGSQGANDESSSGWQVKPTKEMRQADLLRKRQGAALPDFRQEVPATQVNAATARAPAAAEASRAPAAAEAVQHNGAAADATATPAVPEATPELAKALIEAGPTIGLLRDGGVSDATLQQLVEANLTSLEQIMAAHDDGLNNLGIKKGPRIRILRILSPLTLESEDEGVKELFERFRLGKYRARCADEQIDIEALTFFAEEPDEALAKDLGVKPEDFQAFREAIGHASE